MSYFSVARHYGGIRINGQTFTYCPERDILVRDDWMEFYQHASWDEFIAAVKIGNNPTLSSDKKSAKAHKKENNNQLSLFDE